MSEQHSSKSNECTPTLTMDTLDRLQRYDDLRNINGDMFRSKRKVAEVERRSQNTHLKSTNCPALFVASHDTKCPTFYLLDPSLMKKGIWARSKTMSITTARNRTTLTRFSKDTSQACCVSPRNILPGAIGSLRSLIAAIPGLSFTRALYTVAVASAIRKRPPILRIILSGGGASAGCAKWV